MINNLIFNILTTIGLVMACIQPLSSVSNIQEEETCVSKPPFLLLHLDINKTLIAEDAATNKSMAYILTNALAEKCIHQWHQDYPPMSYMDYVETVLVPGPKTQESKEKRRAILRDFLQTLEKSDYPQKEKMLALYQQATDKMQGKYLIPSFVKLLKALKEQEVAFRVILRTFGNDIRLGKITKEIEGVLDGERFTYRGHFENGSLHIKEEETMHKVDQIYRFFRDTKGHVAIQDHWESWSKDGERGRSGKPFIYDPNDREVLSLFFDDNINSDPFSEFNIVRAINIKGEPVDLSSAYGKYIHIADTIAAIVSSHDSYYIDQVNQSLSLNGFNFTIKSSSEMTSLRLHGEPDQ